MQKHLLDSSHHNLCTRGPHLIDFENEQDLLDHLDLHRKRTKTENGSLSPLAGEVLDEYHGVNPTTITSVYACALRQRFRKPTPESIIRQTGTDLDHAIVSSLISAALRLLPADKTPEGVAVRVERDKARAAEAKAAERAFYADFSRFGYRCMCEDEQRGLSVLTPDILFDEPTLICGHLCQWLEYKSFFGFRRNPFVGPSNKKQFRKYTEQLGPGAVVYALGFELGHIDIEGVKAFREKEIRQSLTMQLVPGAEL